MSINVIDATNFIKDAFYAMPVFSDENGNNISGVYGALYKLKSMLSENEEALFAFSFLAEMLQASFTSYAIFNLSP